MTKEDIIRMAREAGMPLGIRLVNSSTEPCVSVELERFAKLVAAAERNACETAVEDIARTAAELRRLHHNNLVLTNALWKACGDDREVVNATIESQGELE